MERSFIRHLLWFLLGLFVILLLVGWFWSQEPEPFEVKPFNDVQGFQPVGAVTASTMIAVAETLLDKPGGFLSNDITPPGIWLDNIPSWEYGVVIQLRDLSKAMQQSFSRSQSQSVDDPDLVLAESRFNYDHTKWMFPAAERSYREGIDYVSAYLQRLADDDEHNAQFYARADNLSYWLRAVETRLGNLSQRLSASVGQARLNTDLAGDPEARQSTPAPDELVVKTPWLEIDNVFYEARGSSWALMHFLRAVEVDFAEVLEKKNARVSLQQIIRELEGAQQTLWSPMVLNGDGFGVMANHSLVMASYISRANAALIDLRALLDQG
ncbi:DUF2333 family protein [Porticoccus sp. W117]|uniref:DUF2333 family protein n=1 Tax=Porticoccus sp. W117 TaxID=3054777 RepID=UPI002593C665|nr:DUF2333 family protein [Porticoccus sp. W117]MDM3871446.1 DUF2333 family protein [Porticoccus sp. W117]